MEKRAPWTQREHWAFKGLRTAREERRELLEGAPKRVWKIHSLPLGWVCLAVFPSTLDSCNVHGMESTGCSVLCVSVNSWLFSLGMEKETGFL